MGRLVYIAGALAVGAGAFWWLNRDEPGALLDVVGDAVVTLTTTQDDRLAQLEAETQTRVRGIIAELADRGISVHVGQTLRTPAQEKALGAAGKTSASTAATGLSWHLIGHAADLYVIDPTTGATCFKGERLEDALALSRTAEKWGLRQLGFNADDSPRIIHGVKGPIWDVGHVEFRGPYATLAEATAAEGPAYGVG